MGHFAISTKVYWGDDKYQQLLDLLKLHKCHRITLVVDRGVSGSLPISKIMKVLDEAGLELIDTIVPFIKSEPTYDELDELTNKIKKNPPDAIIGIGGGTVLDLAKGVSVLLKNNGKGVDYRGMNKVSNPPLPFVAIPTTAGTGSEVTWTAAFIDKVDNKKLGINGKNVAPMCALLDPEFLVHCPKSVAVGSGLDAMVHAIEAVTAKTSSLLTEMLGAQAFSIMYEYLPLYVEGDRSANVCTNLLFSSYIAGIAMMNAGGGPASGISYPLGVHYGVPHGFAGGIFLKHVFKANVGNGYRGYERVYNLLPDAIAGHQDPSQHFLQLFDDFYNRIGAPNNLNSWGCVGSEDIQKLYDLTINQRIENLELNPIDFSNTDLIQLLNSVCTR